MKRREYRPEDLDPKGPYHMMTATIIPRPIAWVSSRSADGVDNLAPHSFFTVVSGEPPIVQFTSVGRKDTLNNVEATGEFVVNVCPEGMLDLVNDSAPDYPPGLSEFDELGIEREPSRFVAPPRVAGSPVSIECRLERVIPVGNCFVVWGEVVRFALHEDVLDLTRENRPHPRAVDLAPLARLGKNEWSTLGRIIDEPRKKYSDLKPHTLA